MPSIAKFEYVGPIWFAFTRWLSKSDLTARSERKLDVLESLHAGLRFTDLDIVPSTWDQDQVDGLKQHINVDWFGLVPDGAGGWTEPDGLDEPPTGSGIGGWTTWWGRAEPVARDTVIRAIEVSLGVEHRAWNPDAPVSLADYGLSHGTEPPRNWPIDFTAVAPAPWFGASVTWNHARDDAQQGRVSVTWSTPGDGTTIGATAADDEPEGGSRFGSWAISQAEHAVVPAETWAPSGLGEWSSPLAIVWSHGPVVTSAPDLSSGGVDPNADF